ncbi:hypothetical protein [Desulfohalobium retbaense]|nr:hypothetical protein [Desulfohalobium retbaense]
MRCKDCGVVLSPQAMQALIDDLWEERLANVPCDRL